jgi:hypothetical protein
VLDGAGGALVAWDDFQSNGQGADSTADVYVQRVTLAGKIELNWPATGLQVTNASQNQAWPALIADGTGGGIVAWEDARLRTPFPAEAYDLVYASRIGPGGGFVSVPDGSVGPGGLGIRLAANPCVGAVDADFESPRSGPARVGLYDVEGRLLESHAAQVAAGRAFRVEFDAAHALRPGLYFVRFAEGGEAVTARVALVR